MPYNVSSETGVQPEKSSEGLGFIDQEMTKKQARVAEKEARFKERNPFLAAQREQFSTVHDTLKKQGHGLLAFGVGLTKPVHELSSQVLNFGFNKLDFTARIGTLGLLKHPTGEIAAKASEAKMNFDNYLIKNVL